MIPARRDDKPLEPKVKHSSQIEPGPGGTANRLADPVAGHPDSNPPSLVTRGHIYPHPAHFISSGDPDLLPAGSLHDDPASLSPRTADDLLDRRLPADFVVAALHQDTLFAPLVVAGLDKHLLGGGLVVSGNPTPRSSGIVENSSQVNAQSQAMPGVFAPAAPLIPSRYLPC